MEGSGLLPSLSSEPLVYQENGVLLYSLASLETSGNFHPSRHRSGKFGFPFSEWLQTMRVWCGTHFMRLHRPADANLAQKKESWLYANCILFERAHWDCLLSLCSHQYVCPVVYIRLKIYSTKNMKQLTKKLIGSSVFLHKNCTSDILSLGSRLGKFHKIFGESLRKSGNLETSFGYTPRVWAKSGKSFPRKICITMKKY